MEQNKSIEAIMEELIEAFPKTESKAPRDTIAHIFRHEHRENFISDWIAYLLSPEKTGTVEGLNSFIKLANSDSYFNEEIDVEINREYTFDDGRRIDFLIESEDVIIGIENKIWSDLEANQLKDYKENLDKYAKGKEIIKILLYPAENKGENIREATGNQEKLYGFVPVKYEELVIEFKNIHIDCISNLRASFMLQDFITHMEEYIMENESKTGTLNFETIAFANNKKEDIKKITNQINECKSQFNKYVVEEIAKTIDESIWEQNAPSSCSFFQVYKSNSAIGWGSGTVHFELVSKGEFPPKEMAIVLHSNEKAKIKRTEKLKGLQAEVKKYLNDKYGSEVVSIDYETEESFVNSFNEIMVRLKDIMDTYEQSVDAELQSQPIKE